MRVALLILAALAALGGSTLGCGDHCERRPEEDGARCTDSSHPAYHFCYEEWDKKDPPEDDCVTLWWSDSGGGFCCTE